MIFTGHEKLFVEISTPSETFEYDLDHSTEISVRGISGETDVVIKDNEVFIINSPCKNKTCIHQGKISKSGQWLCCAPNQVIVIIKSAGTDSREQSTPDALSF